jgi:hypothetical protein
MKKKIIIALIVIILVISLITLIGYLSSRKQKTKEILQTSQTPFQPPKEPLPLSSSKKDEQEQNLANTENIESENFLPLKFKPLIDEEVFYIDFEYPLIYVYAPLSETIKYIDLKEEAYKDLIKVQDYEEAVFSNDKSKVFIKTSKELNLVDIKADKIFPLSKALIKKFYFDSKNNPIIFENNQSNNADIYYFDKGVKKQITNLAILNPEFEILKDDLLIYEKNSPIFSINLKKPTTLNLFLEEPLDYEIISNKNKDLLAISFFKDNNWQTKIIDSNKKTKYIFYWPMIKEKCTFNDILICAIPYNLENFDKDYWRLLKPSYDEKIIIYNPKNDEIKEINLEDKFDIIKPHLTEKGIVFVNRNDNKIYLYNLN